MEITVVSGCDEMDVVTRVLNGHDDMINGDISSDEWRNDEVRYPRKVWLYMIENDNERMPFVVVDNRVGECFVEQFATLDGAMMYACDIYLTGENQDSWDYPGSVKDRGSIRTDEEKWVIRVPTSVDAKGQFVFGYVKKIVPHGKTSEVFCDDIESAMHFDSKERADEAAIELGLAAYSADKNIMRVMCKKEVSCL